MGSGVQSSIGKSRFSGHGPGKKFTVDDAEGTGPQYQEVDPNYVNALRRERQERQEAQERDMFQDARRRIEIITGIGRRTKEVHVDNSVFTLRTLKSFEQNCLFQVAENAERIVQKDGAVSFKPTSMHQIKVEALGHSLFMIDGQSIDIVLGTANEEYEIKLESRKDLVREMDTYLIDYLFLKYEELNKEATDGYMPKNTDEVGEVVDTIRKSGKNT